MPRRNTKATPSPTWAPDHGSGGLGGPGGAETQAQRTPHGGAAGRSSRRRGIGLFLSLSVFLCFSFGLSGSASSFSVSLCCPRPISVSVSVSPRVSPSLLVPMPSSRPQRRRDPPTRRPRGGRARGPDRGAKLAPRGSEEAGGGGRRALPAGSEVRSGAPGGVRGCVVRGAAFRRGTRVPPPLTAAICRHLTAFHLRSDRN